MNRPGFKFHTPKKIKNPAWGSITFWVIATCVGQTKNIYTFWCGCYSIISISNFLKAEGFEILFLWHVERSDPALCRYIPCWSASCPFHDAVEGFAQNWSPVHQPKKLLFLGPLSCLFGGCFFQDFWLGFPNPFQRSRFSFLGFLLRIIVPFFVLLTLILILLSLSLWRWLSPSRCTFDVPQLCGYVKWRPWTEQKGSRKGCGMRR